MHPKSRLSPLAGAALSLGLLALLPGCGGGGSSSNSSNNNGGGSQTANYAEVVTLADGQAGALSLTTSGSSATGTLAVAAASPAVRSRAAGPRVGSTIPVGVYAVTGTYAGGTFTLNGSISGTAFTLTVTPPSGSATGTFSLVTGGATYTGTTTTAPTGTTANSSIAGTYLLVSITNPGTNQSVTCPGSLAFGSSDSDSCGASEITTLNANGTYNITISGTIASTGTYTLVGNIFTQTGKELEASGNGQTVTNVSSLVTSGNTLVTTLLNTTASDQQAQIGEVFTYTKTSGTTAASPFAGTYTGVTSSDPSYGYNAAITSLTVSAGGAVTATVNEGNVIGSVSGSVSNTDAVTVSGGSTQDTYTLTGTFQTVNGVIEVNGTYTDSNQTLPGHWAVVQSAATGAASQIAGAYGGTITSNGSTTTPILIINANGTATLADTSGDVTIGSATVNFNGQVVLTLTNPNNGNVITFTGTLGGSSGSHTLSGGYTATLSGTASGASGTFSLSQFNPNQAFARRR